MAEKLQNKKELKPKEVEKPLTIEQKIALLEEEKKHWKECWNVMIDKFEEFFPLKKFEESLDDVPKKDIRDVIYQYLYEAVDKVDEEFKKRKTKILNQMPPAQRWEWDWNQLQKEKQDWDKIYQAQLKENDEYYKTHPGGGLMYRWLSEEHSKQIAYFRKIENQLQNRNPEFYAKKIAELKKQKTNEQEK